MRSRVCVARLRPKALLPNEFVNALRALPGWHQSRVITLSGDRDSNAEAGALGRAACTSCS
jgi:hypothetical protein